MSQDATLRTLLTELMAGFDSTIDTAVGSNFDSKVMTPFLERIGGSPLDVDLEAFMVERLETEIDGIDVSEFAGVRDLLVRAAVVIIDPLRREINAVKISQSLNNVASMTRAEVNAHLGNFFTSLRDGGFSSGVVRMLFLSPQSVSVTPITRFSTGNGLNFFPQFVQAISQELMAFNQDGTLYYFDVLVVAEEAGEAYNIAAGSINSVQGIVGVVRVSNLADFDNAIQAETKEEGVAHAGESITTRTLAVERGIAFVLKETFRTLDTVQVISKKDPEMLRDVIRGPATISEIPGGFVGDQSPSIGGGQEVHVGGMTDVYVYQRSLVTDAVDIQNLTNRGVRVYAGVFGFTQAGSPTVVFEDTYGQFVLNGVRPGDILRVGNVEQTIVTVDTAALTLGGTLAAGLFNQDYEVVRLDTNLIQVPLYDLVAEAAGTGVTDEDGDPVQPIPGDLDLGQLIVSGDQVKKTVNIAENNVQYPLVRAVSVEFLDPLTLEAAGVFIPMKDVLIAKNLTAFAGGGVGTPATGVVRLLFLDPVSAWVRSDQTTFVYQTVGFRPVDPLNVNARVDAVGTTLILIGANYTSSVTVGDRIIVAGTVRTVVGTPIFSSPNTLVEVREAFDATFASTAAVVHPGVLETDMPQDAATRLYYFDVAVVAILNGVGGNLPAETIFTPAGVASEGWSLRTTKSVLSFSTRELPYIEFTPWVNDTTDLNDVGTAYAIRVNYEYASTVSAMQEFVDDPSNRVVGEDILIRHFLPAYVRGSFAFKGSAASTAVVTRIGDFLLDLDPTEDLEVSDLVTDLKDIGVTKVTLPVTLVGLVQAADRTWTAVITQDVLTSSRVQHFLPEENQILASVITG